MPVLFAAILLLSSCFLGLRWYGSVTAPAPPPAATALPPAGVELRHELPRQGAGAPLTAPSAAPAFAEPGPARPESASQLPPVAPDLSHVREFAFDAAALHALAEGDRFGVDFPPLGGRYELHIDAVLEASGERTIRGHIDYDRRQYPTVITLTGGWSFGSFVTPEGHFEFTARGGLARMVTGAELERRAYAPNHTLRPRRS